VKTTALPAAALLAALALIQAGALPAQDLNLDQAFAAALKQSESLASQQELVLQAEERYKQAVGDVLPSATANALWFLEDGHALPKGPGQPSAQQTSYHLSADQPLFRGLREYAALRLAKGQIAYQDLARQWASLQLYSDTAQAYYLVLAQQKDLETLQKEVELYAKRVNDLKEFVRIGRSRPTDVLTVQAAQAVLVAQIESSKALLDSSRQMLAFLTGLPAETALADGESPTAASEPLQSYLALIPSRPDIQAAQKNIDLAQENVKIAWGQHLPTADLSANYYPERPAGSNQNVQWDAEIALSLPLFMGGSIAAQTRQAESQVRQAELALRQQSRMAEADMRTAFQDLGYDLSQARALDDAYQITSKNYEAEVDDYENGLVTNLDVLQALTSYQDTLRALDKARYAAKTDFARLQSLGAKISLPVQGDKEP
jgi:outer membrane protein